MIMRHFFAILLLLAAIPLAHAGGSKPPPQTPAASTRTFLDTYGQEAALQEIKRLDKMRSVLSKELLAALRAARIEQDASTADHPGGKSGLVDLGFNSGEDNAFDSYDIRLTNTLAKNRVAVDVEFIDSAQDTSIRWRDRYEWVLEGKTWKLDDIVFRSTGSPSSGEHRLKTLLRPH